MMERVLELQLTCNFGLREGKESMMKKLFD